MPEFIAGLNWRITWGKGAWTKADSFTDGPNPSYMDGPSPGQNTDSFRTIASLIHQAKRRENSGRSQFRDIQINTCCQASGHRWRGRRRCCGQRNRNSFGWDGWSHHWRWGLHAARQCRHGGLLVTQLCLTRVTLEWPWKDILEKTGGVSEQLALV